MKGARVDVRRKVAAEETWLYAGTAESGGRRFMVVYRSIWTEEFAVECMRPVESYLDAYCHTMPGAPFTVEDVTMMGGKAVVEQYEIFVACPAFEHRCATSVSTVIMAV